MTCIHLRFERTPLRNKLITEIPGLKKYHIFFHKKKIIKATQLLGIYMLLNLNNDCLNKWLTNELPMISKKHRFICINALSNWTYNNL
jgi:hypothetical protein